MGGFSTPSWGPRAICHPLTPKSLCMGGISHKPCDKHSRASLSGSRSQEAPTEASSQVRLHKCAGFHCGHLGLRCAGAFGKLRRTCISGSSPQGARKVGDLYPSTHLLSGEGCFPQGRGGPSPILSSCPTFRPNVRLQPSLQLSGGDMAGHRPHESVHPPCHLSTPPLSSMDISSRKPSLTSPRKKL